MSYSTTEAFIEKTSITFKDDFFIPSNRTRVLVTFIDDDLIGNKLYELDNSEVTDELLKGSKKVLEKDESLLTNI